MIFRLCNTGDAEKLLHFYQKNADHFRKWEPARSEDYQTLSQWQLRLAQREKDHQGDRARYFLALSDDDNTVLAACNLTNICLFPVMSCSMGYGAEKATEGKGVMKMLCLYAIDHAFNQLGLHRVKADYMPINERSGALLKSLGFSQEGYAKSYVKINGRWEDHVLTSLINPRD